MEITISNLAKNDLEDIWRFTQRRWTKKQANDYLRPLFKEIDNLKYTPYLGSDCSAIRQNYRKLTYKSHNVYYKVSVLNSSIEIIRILHHSRDVRKLI